MQSDAEDDIGRFLDTLLLYGNFQGYVPTYIRAFHGAFLHDRSASEKKSTCCALVYLHAKKGDRWRVRGSVYNFKFKTYRPFLYRESAVGGITVRVAETQTCVITYC